MRFFVFVLILSCCSIVSPQNHLRLNDNKQAFAGELENNNNRSTTDCDKCYRICDNNDPMISSDDVDTFCSSCILDC